MSAPTDELVPVRDLGDGERGCIACGGDLFPLGRLGQRLHLRCRHCGIDSSLVLEPDDDEPDPYDREDDDDE